MLKTASFCCFLVENLLQNILRCMYMTFYVVLFCDIIIKLGGLLMVEFTLEPFANDSFRLLKSLKKNQVEVCRKISFFTLQWANSYYIMCSPHFFFLSSRPKSEHRQNPLAPLSLPDSFFRPILSV